MGAYFTGAVTNPRLLLAAAALFWAAHWIVVKAITPYTTPVSLSFWRWAAALALLAPFAAPRLAHDWPAIRRAWPAFLFFGTCGTVLYNAIAYVGIRDTSAINALLFQSVTPVIIPLFAWVLFRERIRPLTAAGLAVSLCGVIAIITRLEPRVLASLELNPGDLWLLGHVALWSLYTACLRWSPKDVAPLSFMFAVMCAGMLTGLPGWLVELSLGGRFEPNAGSIAGILYLGAFPSILCYLMWNRGVAAIGPAKAGAYLHLTPLFGTILAMAFLGERLGAFHVVGFGLIIGGVWLATRRGG
jgi:drug/metabolite transporter (DMT)-like permease